MPPYRARLSIYEVTSESRAPSVTFTTSRVSGSEQEVAGLSQTSRCSKEGGEDDSEIALACRRIQELEDERNALVNKLKAEAERNDLLQKSANVIQRAYEQDLDCPICREVMTTPFILQTCGHAFCFHCLRYHLADTVAKQANDDDHRHRIPRRLRKFDPLMVTPTHLKKLRKLMPKLHYKCPLCRAPFSSFHRPMHVPVLQSIVTAMVDSNRILSPAADDDPVITACTGTWDGLFRP